MRGLLGWLMMICVLAGLNSRVTAAVCDDPADCCHASVAACCEGDPHAGQTSHSHQEGDDCPMDTHHHHTCCAHVFVLGIDPQLPCRLGVPASVRTGFRHQGEVAPDGPFLSSEKPPLI